MKAFILVVFALVVFSCSPSSPPAEGTQEEPAPVNIQTLEQEAFQIYQESPAKAISLLQQVAPAYEANGNLPKAGITYLNIANIFDEQVGQMDSALVYSQQALAIWEAEQDTLQLANLYKYVGLLKGRVGSGEEAKTDIQHAIDLYQAAGFDQGIAVSRLNLAKVYLREGNYAASETLYTQSKEFWQTDGDLGRVFTTNLLGIQLYYQLGDPEQAKELIKENEVLLNQLELDGLNRDRFEALVKEVAE